MNSTASDPQSERKKRIAARQEMLKARTPRDRVVRVEPANDAMRKYLKHPAASRFPESGSVEWPLDRFTRRRINEGSVKVVEHGASRQPSHQQHQRRSTSGEA